MLIRPICGIGLAALLVLTGCATTQTVWTKNGASQQEFYEARGQCQAQAFGLNPGASMMQVAIVFSGCMQGKGWYQTEVPR